MRQLDHLEIGLNLAQALIFLRIYDHSYRLTAPCNRDGTITDLLDPVRQAVVGFCNCYIHLGILSCERRVESSKIDSLDRQII
jgi:hypothetical protein